MNDYTSYLKRNGMLDEADPKELRNELRLSWAKREWEKGETLDFDPEERQEDCLVTTEIDGVTFEGVGTYSCGNLISVEDIEIQKLK